jgi:hypothetical protein
MILDEELLRKAQAAGTRLADAEHQTQLARADYHTLVRRLHLAGGSLREIAGALSLSHQRVQQIVDVAGGSWWQRIWRTRTIKRDVVCTFCGGPPAEVSKLIAGPNVYVCDACVGLAEQELTGGGQVSPTRKGAKAQCSFCAKRRTASRPLFTRQDASVCTECLRLCREILNDRSG